MERTVTKMAETMNPKEELVVEANKIVARYATPTGTTSKVVPSAVEDIKMTYGQLDYLQNSITGEVRNMQRGYSAVAGLLYTLFKQKAHLASGYSNFSEYAKAICGISDGQQKQIRKAIEVFGEAVEVRLPMKEADPDAPEVVWTYRFKEGYNNYSPTVLIKLAQMKPEVRNAVIADIEKGVEYTTTELSAIIRESKEKAGIATKRAKKEESTEPTEDGQSTIDSPDTPETEGEQAMSQAAKAAVEAATGIAGYTMKDTVTLAPEGGYEFMIDEAGQNQEFEKIITAIKEAMANGRKGIQIKWA